MKVRHAAMVIAVALVVTSCGGNGGGADTTAAPAAAANSKTDAPATSATPTTTTISVSTTTATTTTTTAPPVPDPEAVEFINTWASLLNAGDHGAAADMVVAARKWDAPGDSDEERERLARVWFEVWVVLESEFFVDECATRSTGITECRITRHVELSPHAPDPETSLLRVRFDDDGSLAYAGTVPKQADPWWGQYVAFQQWAFDVDGDDSGPDEPYGDLFGEVDVAEYEQLLAKWLDIWRAEQGT